MREVLGRDKEGSMGWSRESLDLQHWMMSSCLVVEAGLVASLVRGHSGELHLRFRHVAKKSVRHLNLNFQFLHNVPLSIDL